jgi:hypothetical protein
LGVVRDSAELARLGRVSRACLNLSMNLLLVVLDIQEEMRVCFARAKPARRSKPAG